jgi:DNA-binding GntR family transcriptional regulator
MDWTEAAEGIENHVLADQQFPRLVAAMTVAHNAQRCFALAEQIAQRIGLDSRFHGNILQAAQESIRLRLLKRSPQDWR